MRNDINGTAVPRGVLTPLYLVPPPRARGRDFIDSFRFVRSSHCLATTTCNAVPFRFLTTHNLRRAGRVFGEERAKKNLTVRREPRTHGQVKWIGPIGTSRRRSARGYSWRVPSSSSSSRSRRLRASCAPTTVCGPRWKPFRTKSERRLRGWSTWVQVNRVTGFATVFEIETLRHV